MKVIILAAGKGKRMDDLTINTPKPLLIYKGKNIQVTMSIGATIHKDSDTPDSLISRADKALYKAKTNGKNQMCVEIA